MGYDIYTLQISARLSRHNDERDIEHNALWEELKEEIETLVEGYQEIDATWVA